MKIKSKYCIFFSLCLVLSCHYHKANLIIKNNTAKKIWYSTFAKNKENKFYNISSGGFIDPFKSDSPIIRGKSESFRIDVENYEDKSIYLAFYLEDIQKYVYRNPDSMIMSSNLKLTKYNIKELNNLDWKIIYSNKK